MTTTRRRPGARRRLALSLTLLGSLTVAALPATGQEADQGGWPTADANGQHTRQGVAPGPVDPVVDWVWDDDTYESDGSIGGTRANIPGVLDHDGRLLFKSRNTAFDDLEDEPARYDLLALDPADGTRETLLTDLVPQYCQPGVAPDGTIWTFQDVNDRTKGMARHPQASAWLVGIDPDTGRVTARYSGEDLPDDTAGVTGCTGGVQFGPDGTVLTKDYPRMLDAGGFRHWFRGLNPDGSVRFNVQLEPDDGDQWTREYRYAWILVAPDGTPGEGVAYLGYRTADDAEALGVAALDLDSGAVVRSHQLTAAGGSFMADPVIDPAGGLVFSLEGGNGTADRLVRVVDDGETLSQDWRVDADPDADGATALRGALRSLQVAGQRIVGWSDADDDVVSVRWDDGSFVWTSHVGFRNSDQVALDAAGYGWVARLTGSGDDDAAVQTLTPSGGIAHTLTKGAIAAENGGEGFGVRTVGPLAANGHLYLWGGDNNWVAVSGRDASRLAGATRYDTAAEIATHNFPRGVDTVFLAVGTNFPDALTAGPLAAHLGAPVLLSDAATLPSETAAALDDLQPANVVALGGTTAISDAVLDAAAQAAGGAATDRIFGPSRYGTAAAIAARLPKTGTVYLAVGTNYPDTLAGGPATDGAPILLTATDALPQETRAALADRQPNRVVALGGTVAVSDQVLADAAAAAGGAATDRLSGQTRYSTGVAIGQTVVDGGAFTGTVFVAVGTNYPDAVSAASAAAAVGAPIVLTAPDHLPDEVSTWLQGLDPLTHVVILGGTGAVSSDVAADLAALVD